jgi:hypothetical protein
MTEHTFVGNRLSNCYCGHEKMGETVMRRIWVFSLDDTQTPTQNG